MRASVRPALTLALVAAMTGGCDAPPRNDAAVRSYYGYDFTAARAALRPDAARNDRDVLLNNLRLGLAALADGDAVEAEQALGRAFDLLSTAGLNEARTAAAILLHEGVRIWKGEPFEQALAYYWIAALYATLGDWENTRAASANALFRLTDFGADHHGGSYTALDTDFALGFLMQAVASDLSGVPGRDEQLEAALGIDRDLAPIVNAVRKRTYDTLLLVDYGKGPTKVAYGPDASRARFAPQERHRGPLRVSADGTLIARVKAACDVDRMAADHRWNNFQDVRAAKSMIGHALMTGGSIALARGDSRDSQSAAMVGLAMMLAGGLTRAGAQADTRYMEFAPQSIYLVPLSVQQTCTLRLLVEGDPGSTLVLPGFVPGRPGAPRAVYLRLHGLDGPDPEWLTATRASGPQVTTPDPHRGQTLKTPQAYSMGDKRLRYATTPSYRTGPSLARAVPTRPELQHEEISP